MRRYLWALLFWIFAVLTATVAYFAWDISEGDTPHNAAVLIAAFVVAGFATIAVFCMRELFRVTSRKAKK
jgi:hypothetical protein